MRAVFIVALYIFVVDAVQNVFEYEMNRASDYVEQYERKLHPKIAAKLMNVKSFSWNDCGTKNSMVAIKALSLTPDPISFPGPLNVATKFIIKQVLARPLKGELKIYKKEFGVDIEIPCIDDFGSCTYDDLCSLLIQIQSQCPDQLKTIGIDCACPFQPGSYNLDKTQFDINASVIPTGDYHVIANITMNENEAVCLDIKLEIV